MNKLKQIAMIVGGLLIAIFFYGKKKKAEGIKQEQNKQIKVENTNLRRSRKIQKEVNNLTDAELDKQC